MVVILSQRINTNVGRRTDCRGKCQLKGSKIMQERRYDVDWLSIIAMLAVFLFHCTCFFDPDGWHLKNTEQSKLLFVLTRGGSWSSSSCYRELVLGTR